MNARNHMGHITGQLTVGKSYYLMKVLCSEFNTILLNLIPQHTVGIKGNNRLQLCY